MSKKSFIGRNCGGYKSKDGLVVDYRDGSSVDVYDKICEDNKNKKLKWIDWLRQGGIKAAHPDDGWHERDKGYFQFSYPYFNDGVKEGDMVALGDYEKFIVLVVTGIDKSFFGMTRYKYSFHYR